MDWSTEESTFHSVYPLSADLPDTCKVTRRTTATQNSYGDYTTAFSDLFTGKACRIDPVAGRFSRIEGITHTKDVTADYIVTIAFLAGIRESDRLVITASDNTDFVNKVLDIVLVMDAAGDHTHMELICNEVR